MTQKFNLYGEITVSAYTTVIADSLEQAIEIATQRDAVIGGICSGADPCMEWVVEEMDGEVTKIYGEKNELTTGITVSDV